MAGPGYEPPPAVKRRVWPAFVGAALIAAVLGAGGVLLVTGAFGRGDDSDTSGAGSAGSEATVHLQPVGYSTDEPFTESVVTVSEDVLSDLSAASGFGSGPGTDPTGQEGLEDQLVHGDASRLYATRSEGPVCDVARLAALLTEDPAVTEAWAVAAGVDPAAVSDLVASYTPVLLGFDTAVTNHVYGSDGASAFQAILQAGTPVLIDDRGVPRTQCSCGNPLAEPSRDTVAALRDRSSVDDTAADDTPADLRGDAWEGFEAAEVVRVEPAADSTPVIETVDIDDGTTIKTATGATVSLEGMLLAHDTGVDVVAEDGTRTPVLDVAVETVVDDGEGGLIYTTGRTVDPYGYYAPPTDEADGVIWHLRAGATEAEPLTPDDGDPDTWDVLRGAGTLGGETLVVYYQLEPDPDYASEGLIPKGPALLLDLETGASEVLEEYGHGWETGTGPFSFGADRLAYERGYAYPDWVVLDADLDPIENTCGGIDEFEADQDTLNSLEDRCSRRANLDEQGRFVSLTEDDLSTAAYSLGDIGGISVMDPVTGEVIHTVPVAFDPGGEAEHRFDYDLWDGRLVINAEQQDSGPQAHTEAEAVAIVTVDTGEVRELGLPGPARFLRAPLQRPRASLDSLANASPPEPDTPEIPEITLGGIGEVRLGMDGESAIAAGTLEFERDDVCPAEVDGSTTDDFYSMPGPPGTTIRVLIDQGTVWSFSVEGEWKTAFGVSSGESIAEIADRFGSEGWEVSVSGEDDIFGEGRLEASRGEDMFTIEPGEDGLAYYLHVPRPIYCD